MLCYISIGFQYGPLLLKVLHLPHHDLKLQKHSSLPKLYKAHTKVVYDKADFNIASAINFLKYVNFGIHIPVLGGPEKNKCDAT